LPAEEEVSVPQSNISEAHIILGKRRRGDAEERETKRAKTVVEEESAIEWVSKLQRLIKGKTRMDREVCLALGIIIPGLMQSVMAGTSQPQQRA
jgi:hypothetical protein